MRNIVMIKIETVEAGQRGPYKDSFYHYKLETTGLSEYEAKMFCETFLTKGRGVYKKKDMPNPFAYELLELKTELIEEKNHKMCTIFRYKSLYTG